MPALFVSTDFRKGIGFDQGQRGSFVQGRAVSVGLVKRVTAKRSLASLWKASGKSLEGVILEHLKSWCL